MAILSHALLSGDTVAAFAIVRPCMCVSLQSSVQLITSFFFFFWLCVQIKGERWETVFHRYQLRPELQRAHSSCTYTPLNSSIFDNGLLHFALLHLVHCCRGRGRAPTHNSH
jgi:hypothetical protein